MIEQRLMWAEPPGLSVPLGGIATRSVFDRTRLSRTSSVRSYPRMHCPAGPSDAPCGGWDSNPRPGLSNRYTTR